MILAIVLYIIICVLLVGFILLQQNQGGGLGILGGSSDSVLGTAQESFLSKIIKSMAVLFVVGALFLSIMSTGKRSLLDREEDIPLDPQNNVPTLEGDISTNLDDALPDLDAPPTEDNVLPDLIEPTQAPSGDLPSLDIPERPREDAIPPTSSP